MLNDQFEVEMPASNKSPLVEMKPYVCLRPKETQPQHQTKKKFH